MKRFSSMSRFAAVAILVLAADRSSADLKSFLAKPESVYKWEKRNEEKKDGCTVYDLHMTSQTWQGKPWEHRLVIFRPDNAINPKFCLLYNTGGSGSIRDLAMGIDMATRSKTAYAMLFNIPNQPLYGLTEDALIVYTWQKYMETGDDSWPLHFPMAKSVIKAMDAIGEFTKGAGIPVIDQFIINGGSKRGWTTWLAGASEDKRIKAIAPMVIDILNVMKQMPHQLEMYGKPSEQVGDYTNAGMFRALNTSEGKKLLELEDPISYKNVLTMPKLLILGTNDRYWSQDALNLYWDDLKGDKYVSYTPNSGHGLEDRPHVFATLTSFTKTVATGKKWPKLKWEYKETPAGVTLNVSSDVTIKSARLYSVESATTDFRDSKWSFLEMSTSGKKTSMPIAPPGSMNRAVFGELTFNDGDSDYTLSTQMRIVRKK
ncbi:MAG: PhoPQ-activated protein PqaA family protein [Chthonomonadales bacterium]